MKHIIHSHLMKYLDSHHILCDQQQGCRKRRSCESQLLTTVHDLASGFDKWQQIHAILLDFRKAFDKVAHQHLSIKLHHYGVRNKTPTWIKSFLADQYQRVVLDGKKIIIILCYFWCSVGHRPWTSLVPDHHQRPAISCYLYSAAFRRRLPAVQSYLKAGRCSVITARSCLSTGMGDGLANAFLTQITANTSE